MKLLAENINGKVDDDSCKSFYLEIGNKVFDTIKSSRLTADSRMNMFTIFHNNSLQDHGRKLWIDLLENAEFPTSVCNILYQYILDKFLKYALNYRNKQFEKDEVMINYESTKLDESEEQTLRYVAGFVLYKLFGLVKHKEKPEGKVMEQVLSVWGAKWKFPEHNPMSLFDYTNAWVEKVNRGGLYEVSDQFYLFIHTVELVVRRVLNYNLIVTNTGEDLREVLLSKLLKHEYVQTYWSTITRHIDNTVLKDTLLLKDITNVG